MDSPSPEIAEFLQQITEVQQSAHRGKLGGFSRVVDVGEDYDNEQIIGIAGSTIVTEVWARSESGVWSTSKKELTGFTRYFARWRFPTILLWRRLGSSRQNLFLQEKKLWKVFLTETSLTQKPLTFSENILSDDSFADIMDFSPASIPTSLVRSFLKSTTLSQQELYQIEQECVELWRTDSGSVRDPHPLLKEVVNSMNLYERFGIQTWPTLGEVPVRTYAVIEKVVECYNEAMALNQKDESVRAKAAKLAGVRRPRVVQ